MDGERTTLQEKLLCYFLKSQDLIFPAYHQSNGISLNERGSLAVGLLKDSEEIYNLLNPLALVTTRQKRNSCEFKITRKLKKINLPDELLVKIFKYDNGVLKSTCLVNKQWNKVSTHLLWRNPHMKSLTQSIKFCTALESIRENAGNLKKRDNEHNNKDIINSLTFTSTTNTNNIFLNKFELELFEFIITNLSSPMNTNLGKFNSIVKLDLVGIVTLPITIKKLCLIFRYSNNICDLKLGNLNLSQYIIEEELDIEYLNQGIGRLKQLSWADLHLNKRINQILGLEQVNASIDSNNFFLLNPLSSLHTLRISYHREFLNPQSPFFATLINSCGSLTDLVIDYTAVMYGDLERYMIQKNVHDHLFNALFNNWTICNTLRKIKLQFNDENLRDLLTNCRNIEELSFSENSYCTDAIFGIVKQFSPKIRRLDFKNLDRLTTRGFYDKFLDANVKLEQLEFLGLSDTGIAINMENDLFLTILSSFDALKELDIRSDLTRIGIVDINGVYRRKNIKVRIRN